MPSKKKKYNARFPAGRIKKIMQSDEEIGKVAQAVPVIISRTLELFVESLLAKTLKITNTRNAKTLSTSHLKQCIMAEQRFDFLRELVKNVPDISLAEEAACNYTEDDVQSSPEQDSLSDAASEYTKASNITDFSEITTTASSAMIQIDTPLDMRKNGLNVDNENNDLANTNNETIRCTRNVKYYQQQPLHRSHHESDRVNKFSTLKASSVIMHTNSVKLLRAESAPDAQTIRGGGGYGSAKRSRHHKIAATCTGESASSSVSTTDSAAAAPVLNFDFSSNPLVQINCSNIQTTNVTKDEDGVVGGNVMKSSLAHSTPAVASTFDLSHTSTPNISINIDLSSININATNKKPAAVTITTVDDNSNNEPQAAIYSNIINTSIPNIAIMPKAINTSTSTTSMSATNENTLLELDEDYDNI